MIRNASEGVIGIHEKNPHYFQYKGKEILLITSAEHYGAVINKRFDYVKYFDKLAKYGCNYTRIYPGAFNQPKGTWMKESNMADLGENYIAPWARSDVPGFAGGGNKFDLSKWDPEYFTRLDDFLIEAAKRDIIVEICFFNCMYIKYWPLVPLQIDANINGVGDCDIIDFQTLDCEPLVREQLRYIEKLIIETNKHNNVIYEFCDEPTLRLTNSQKAFKWVSTLIDKAIEVEEKLPKKHLLAQQLEIGIDFCDDERISVITTQYIRLNDRQIGGVPALDSCYCYDKPIECNETMYIMAWVTESLIPISRLESWDFMVHGGAAYNQLNGFFIVSNPGGDDEVNHAILQNLKNLRDFLESFDYIKMIRGDRDIVQKMSVGGHVSIMAEKGRQYALYIHHCFPNLGRFKGSYFEPNYGNYEPVVTLAMEKGDYNVTFIDPETMKVIKETSITCDGGTVDVACPPYSLDIAVKILAAE